MKNILILMMISLCLISSNTFADANANAGSTSSAGAVSGSSANGYNNGQGQYQGQGQSANNAQGQSIVIGGGTGAGTLGAGASSLSPFSTLNASTTTLDAGDTTLDAGDTALSVGFGLDQSDHSTTTIEATDLGDAVPSVFAAGVTAGGSNPCVVSVGGGASFSGGGFNFARAFNDGECQVRESLRLMVAILPNNNDKGSQVLIRETACQSDIYWQSMERVYINTNDKRFLCSNPRPDNKPIAIRDRALEDIVETAVKKPVKNNYVYEDTKTTNGFW